VIHSKAAKTTNFDAMTFAKASGHGIEDGLDGLLGIAQRELPHARSQAFN
jgi:hypothetical protein